MALTKYMATSQDTYPEHSHQWILIAYTGERPSVRYRNFGPFPSRQDAIEFMGEYKKKYTSPVPISQWLIDPLCNPVGGNPNRLTSSGTVLECRSDISGEPSMTNDFRALCAELLRGLDENRHPEVRYPGHLRQIMASARSALADEPAVPEVEGPSDEELGIDPEHTGDDRALLRTFYAACLGEGGTADEICLRGLRAVLAQPAPPADGEVAELVGEARYLVRELSDQADDLNPSLELFGLMNQAAANLARTAELLQQMEDLAADAVAGLRYIEESCGRLYGVGWDRVYGKADRLKPAHALPLPEVSE